MRSNPDQFNLARNIQSDATEAFAEITFMHRGGVDQDKSFDHLKTVLIDNHIDELTLTRYEDDLEKKLKIRLIGASALSDVEGVLVETREEDDSGATTKLYNVRRDKRSGKSEFIFMASNNRAPEHDFPYQPMPGGAVEDMTRILKNRGV